MVEKYCYSKILMKFFWGGDEEMKTRKNKRMVNFEFFFKTFPFWTFIFVKDQHTFFGAWLFLLVHIRFPPSEGSKGFVNFIYFKKFDHGSWTIKSYHGKMPYSMIRLHGPWCKLTLSSPYSISRRLLGPGNYLVSFHVAFLT